MTERLNRIPRDALHLLVPLLVAHDSAVQESRFSAVTYSCEVCLTSVRGARCIRLSCSHIFCRSCLENFWKLCIREGDIGRVGCPDVSCVKDGTEASEEEVRRVVTETEVQRWRWLRQKRLFEKGMSALFLLHTGAILIESRNIDPTMTHCPIPLCQTPVAKPTNVEEGSSWERLRTCPECQFSFCAYCRHAWYGFC